jgi:hypothetical protein
MPFSVVAWTPTKRLEMFKIDGGALYDRWSGDGGNMWSPWVEVPLSGDYAIRGLHFTGTPAVVSDRPGRLWVTAKLNDQTILYNSYEVTNGSWRGWQAVPTFPDWLTNGTELRTDFGCPLLPCHTFDYYYWNPDSDTALASWGPGRLELFVNARRDRDGAQVLMHTWADNATWSDDWEVLGSGDLVGSPTAISWGPGRTDVFVHGGANGLAHKWFAQGSWSSGWDDLGPCMTTSPSVASAGVGHLDVYVRGCDGALWHKFTAAGGWSDWDWQGGFLVDGTSPTATSAGSGNLDVFVLGLDGTFQKSYNYGWAAFRPLNETIPHSAVIYWVR